MDVTHAEMETAIKKSMKRYPNCRIASCDCDSKHGEWKQGCHCLCHMLQMNERYGKGNWSMDDYERERQRGWPRNDIQP
jgi:hypothetical protein